MRPIIHTRLSLILVLLLSFTGLSAQEEIRLPAAQKTGGMPLFEALDHRQTIRSFNANPLSEQDLSNLLWAAFGINRDDGRRTAPSARNWQEFDIYLIMADGWYVYDPQSHAIIKQGSEDLRGYAGGQDFVATAPLNLIFVSDRDRMTGVSSENHERLSSINVGYISQNVYLFCASEGLATVARGYIDKAVLHEVLQLSPSQKVILGQTVGYPAP